MSSHVGIYCDLLDFSFLLDIFNPLFEVTLDPTSNPKLHLFLQSCVGFDMVDDESLRERPFNESLPTPEEWTYEYDPPYALFAYYLYANICALNKLRVYRGMSSFSFRPHSGEAGDIEHLAATFLLAKSINHGIMLQKSPALQYLYYLAQIGISMSPLSNNLLFLEYEKNPFVKVSMRERGNEFAPHAHVSLSIPTSQFFFVLTFL